MGVWTPLPSERNRNLDFSDLNEEAVGQGFLVLNLEGTGGDRDSGIPTMWAGQCPSRTAFFFHYLLRGTTIPLHLSG